VLINFNSTVETEDGPIECFEGNASVAISSSIAVRIVPVGPDGTEYPEDAFSFVGSLDAEDIENILAQVKLALEELVN
jgi:hypothetical protein